jgi:hypothetical protein
MFMTVRRRPVFVQEQFALRQDSLIGIHGGMGRRILVREGEIWLTQEGDTKDHFLAPDARFEITRDGLTLIQACRPSLVVLSQLRGAS